MIQPKSGLPIDLTTSQSTGGRSAEPSEASLKQAQHTLINHSFTDAEGVSDLLIVVGEHNRQPVQKECECTPTDDVPQQGLKYNSEFWTDF